MHLAATRLLTRKRDGMFESFLKRCYRSSGFWKERVDIAGDEQADAQVFSFTITNWI